MSMEQMIIADLQAAGHREVPRAVHDALCTVRVATRQEGGLYLGLLHCAFCGFFYAPPELEPGPDPNHACAAHDDAHLGKSCPDRTSLQARVNDRADGSSAGSAHRDAGGNAVALTIPAACADEYQPPHDARSHPEDCQTCSEAIPAAAPDPAQAREGR